MVPLRKGIPLYLLFLLIIPLSTFGGYKTTRALDSPAFCDNCHAMEPYAQTFRNSSHGKLQLAYGCMECHGDVKAGFVESRYLGKLSTHFYDGPSILVGALKGEHPDTSFNPTKPRIPSERCLACHNPDPDKRLEKTNIYPVTPEDHSKPIDVSEEFKWVLENPTGEKYQCRICHSFVVHSTDGPLLPTERGKKWNFIHPGIPSVPLAEWKQYHFKALIGGEQDIGVCKTCHVGSLRPAEVDTQCQGCHSDSHQVSVDLILKS
jgi:hypothetical protein